VGFVMRKPFLAGLLVALGLAAAVYLLFGLERTVQLIPWEEPPRPPVLADPSTTPITLEGLMDPRPQHGNALRRKRNELVREHAAALAEYMAGRRPLREVEAIEIDLHVVRFQVGEIDATEMHRRLAVLFDRERQRIESLHAVGAAGPDQVARARLYVARERHGAGLPVEGPHGEGYEALRRAYIESVRKRHETLVDVGLGHREDLALDLERLEDEFPPVPPEPRQPPG
jgi:hypothetical protein